MNALFSQLNTEMRTYIEQLPKQAQHHLARQLASLDRATLQQQQELLKAHTHTARKVKPFESYMRSGNISHQNRGKEALARGEVGCLILAGGDGTRLGYAGPKGTFPISCVKHKSLFQLFAEKAGAVGNHFRRAPPLAIMTSPANHKATLQFFEEHAHFGLPPDQLSFFSQGVLPFLDTDGHLFLSAPDTLAQGPDGNGSALQAFYQSGLWSQWERQGIKYLTLLLVDNPLADPFDAELIGCCQAEHADAIIKSTFRLDEQERVGVVALEKDLPIIVEYTEMPPEEYQKRNSRGDLSYACANIGLFCLTMEFVKRVVLSQTPFPLHKAFKTTPMLNQMGKIVLPTEPNAWKFERFIFDMLPLSKKTHVIVYPRDTCFAPLKNKEGRDSPTTVRAALEKREKEILKTTFHVEYADSPLEIDQAFYYPTEAMRDPSQTQLINENGYISNTVL